MATTLLYQHSLVEDIAQDLYDDSMSKDDQSSKQPAPFKGEFSFVNKDAGNIDSKDHNAAVSWHVMNRYERWKKQEQAKRLRASANVPVGPLASPSQRHMQQAAVAQQQAPTQVTGSGASSREGRSKRSRLTMPTQSVPSLSTSPVGLDPWAGDTRMSLGYSGLLPAPATSSGMMPSTVSSPSGRSSGTEDDPTLMLNSINRSINPYDSTTSSSPLSLTPMTEALTNFAYEVFIPQSWPWESGSAKDCYEIARSWDDASLMSQDTCYANAYLSLLACAMGSELEDDSLLAQSRQFQGNAMRELRQRVALAGPQDLITLKAILKLFSTETLVDNTSVARMHLKMLRNLVNTAGGIILLDAWFREDLLSCDCYFALKYETRPLFPATEWTPGPLSQPWKARLLSAGILGDHAASIDPLLEQPVSKTVVSDLRELFKAHDYTRTHEVPTDDQLLRWQQLRKFDCISRLADHYVNLAIYPHLYHRPVTQSYICLATALMSAMVLGSPEPVRFGNKLLTELRKKLDASNAEGDATQFRRARFWALYVGSLGAKVHALDNEEAEWFKGNFERASQEMGLTGWDDIKKGLKQFLFSENLHQEIESGRLHRTIDARAGLYTASGCSWRMPLTDTTIDLLAESEPEQDMTGQRSGSVSVAAGKRRADAD
jgi:hypothetical protein